MSLKESLKQTPNGKNLSEYQFKLLTKTGFQSVQDFLKADLKKLQNLLDIKKPRIIFELKRELIELLEKEKKPTFATLYEDEKKNLWDHGTGIEGLDKLLEEIGQPCPGLWEIYGSAGAGKTEFLYSLAINFVRQQKARPKQVLFIDCKGDFDALRILNILEERKCAQVDETMDAIKMFRVYTDEHIIAALTALLDQRNQKQEDALAIGLLLIDCLPACFLHLRSKEELILAKAQQIAVASLLRKLNAEGVACVVGNVSFRREEYEKIINEEEKSVSENSRDTTSNEPMLASDWKSVCTLRMSLDVSNPEDDNFDINTTVDDGLRMLKVITNTYGPAGGNCLLNISRAGII